MSVPANDIEDAIVTRLEAGPAFADIARFTAGFVYRVPDDWFPLVEVNVWEHRAVREQTGGRDIIEYIGDIQFNLRLSDAVSTSGRITTVTSSREMKNYVIQARLVLHTEANRKLGYLSGDNWAVRWLEVSRDAVFDVTSRTEKEDDFQLFGKVPFVVQTQEQNS